MPNADISIAMATYNGSRFLRQQLQSFLLQTLLPTELVVCDDGSTDDTIDILEEFAARSPFSVRIYRNEKNIGYRENFINCAGLCTGSIIAFSDQDDTWQPEKLAVQSSRLSQPGILLSTHDIVLDTDERSPSGQTYRHSNIPTECSVINGPPFCYNLGFTIAFKRELLRFSHHWKGSIDENDASKQMAHDQWFCFLASSFGLMHFEEKVLAKYRQHESNVCGANKKSTSFIFSSRDRSEYYERRSKAAEYRKCFIQKSLKDLSGSQRDKAVVAFRFYEKYERALTKRSQILIDPSFSNRLAGVTGALLKGLYFMDSRRHFGLLTAASDLKGLIQEHGF